MNESITIQSFFELVGLGCKTFLVDYVDGYDTCYHGDIFTPAYATDREAIAAIKANYSQQGFVVYCVVEVLHGYTGAELEGIMQTNRAEGIKHLRCVYVNQEIANRIQY